MRLRPAVLLCLALLAGCSSPSTGGAVATVPLAPSSGPTGNLGADQLKALLLQSADLPDLPQRTVYAGAQLTTQAPPQLALCRAELPTAPHALANVLAKGSGVGQVQVFEVVQAYVDAAGAQAAYAQALADARGCPSYEAQGVTFAVEDLADIPVSGGAQAAHYRLTTPDVVHGDVRTIAVQGRYVVLVTGYGAPPAGRSLLDYQADVLRRALLRLS